MGDLSNNLSRHEFACKCGCGLDTVDIETVEIIQDVCDHFGCRVTINSGCRCVVHNVAEGGLPGSFHPQCRAGDCVFRWTDNINTGIIHEYLCEKYPNQYGFGVYNSFNHIDSRSNGPARWDLR